MEPDYSLPIKERVAKWHLQQLDANKNHVIDRQETKSLRLLLKRSPKLRRCSKKIPAFCDINGDKRITADEWLQCLGVAKCNLPYFLPFFIYLTFIFNLSEQTQRCIAHYPTEWFREGKAARTEPVEYFLEREQMILLRRRHQIFLLLNC